MSSYTTIEMRYEELPKAFLNLILSKWKRSLRHGNDFFKLVDHQAYYQAYDIYLHKLFENPACRFRFAVLTEDRDVVLGFAVVRGNVLDYVHVHIDNRRIGIASVLVSHGIDTITHLTRTGLTIWGSKCKGWKFNPFA